MPQFADLKAGRDHIFSAEISGAMAAAHDVVTIPAVDRLSHDTTDLFVIARVRPTRRGRRIVRCYHVRVSRWTISRVESRWR